MPELPGHVLERAVAPVAEQPIARPASSWDRAEMAPLDDVDVEPAVVVEVEQPTPPLEVTGGISRSGRCPVLLDEPQSADSASSLKRSTAVLFSTPDADKAAPAWPGSGSKSASVARWRRRAVRRCLAGSGDLDRSSRAGLATEGRPSPGVERPAQTLCQCRELGRVFQRMLDGDQARIALATFVQLGLPPAQRLGGRCVSRLSFQLGRTFEGLASAGLASSCRRRASTLPDCLPGARRTRPESQTRCSGSGPGRQVSAGASRTSAGRSAARAQSSLIRQTAGSSGRRARHRSSQLLASSNWPSRVARWARPSQTRSSSGAWPARPVQGLPHAFDRERDRRPACTAARGSRRGRSSRRSRPRATASPRRAGLAGEAAGPAPSGPRLDAARAAGGRAQERLALGPAPAIHLDPRPADLVQPDKEDVSGIWAQASMAASGRFRAASHTPSS